MGGTDNPKHHDPERFAAGQRVTWVSVAVNILLTALQVVVGVIAHSQALIADAAHTLSDVVSDFFVLYANRKSAERADEEHPYGHGRYETAASLVLGLILLATGVGILINAVDRLQNLGSAPAVGVAAIWAAGATLVGKELLFRYMLAVAERLRSPMLVANAWHARADALSSLVVTAGVAGALMGFTFADSVAALLVGGMIAKAGISFAWEALQELIDTGLDAEEVKKIRATIEATPGVLGLHELRTRRMAHQVLVDAHLQVDPRISVSEGHRIGEEARNQVLKAHPEVLDMLVHVDAEEDQTEAPKGPPPPPRDVLLEHLHGILGQHPLEVERTIFHYLGQKVEVEVFLSPTSDKDAGRLRHIEEGLTARWLEEGYFGAITFHHRIAPK